VITLHEILTEVQGKVVEKVYQALKSGGKLLVLDLIYPSTLEDFRNPIYDYGFLDQFFEATISTVHLNREEQDELLNRPDLKIYNGCRSAKEYSTFLRLKSKAA
jgi:hypothetical protein